MVEPAATPPPGGIDKTAYEARMIEEMENPPLPDPHDLISDDRMKLFFYGKTFVPMKVVDFLIDSLPMGYLTTPLSHKRDSTIWRYDDNTGIFGPYGISWIQKTMQDLLGEESKTSRILEVVQQLRIKTYDWDNTFNHENPDFIMLMNGAFSLSERKLYSYSPAYKAKARLPVYYDPYADCPSIKKFMAEVFHEEDIPVMEEWLGYHLVKGYPFATMLFLIGDGANGKTTFLNLMTAVLGSENVAKKTLFELNTDRFATAGLYGKLANIAPDVSEDEIKHTGKLKALTGNDEIDVRAIYQSSFKYKPNAKLSAAANKPPKTPDVTRAWFRRQLFVICDRIFDTSEADPHILESLTTQEELNGLFNLMLDGRDRLLENGWFSRDETPDEIQEKYDLMSDPISAFIEDCVIHKAGAHISKDAFYLAFRTYCKKRGFTPCLKGQLTQTLNTKYGRSISISTPRIDERRVPTWNGLGLDLDTSEQWEDYDTQNGNAPPKQETLTKEQEKPATHEENIITGKGGTDGSTPISQVRKIDEKDVVTTPTTPTTPTTSDLKDDNPNIEDLLIKAENILKLNNGKMDQVNLWDNLKKVRHDREVAEPILRKHPRFEFMGRSVKLVEVS